MLKDYLDYNDLRLVSEELSPTSLSPLSGIKGGPPGCGLLGGWAAPFPGPAVGLSGSQGGISLGYMTSGTSVRIGNMLLHIFCHGHREGNSYPCWIARFPHIPPWPQRSCAHWFLAFFPSTHWLTPKLWSDRKSVV